MTREELKELSSKINGHIAAISKVVSNSVFLMKLTIIVGGAVSAVMQFTPSGTFPLTMSQMIGGLAASLVALFAIYLLFAERDAATMLADANTALSAAQDAEAAYENLASETAEYSNQLDKSIELYMVLGNARDIYEQAITAQNFEDRVLIQELLTVSKRHIAAAMNFETSNRWTVCVYKSGVSASGSRELSVIAHIRAIECTVVSARVWPEGVGFSGISLSTAQEIIVGNLQDAAVWQILNVTNGLARQHDAAVYKSAVACPIFVGDENEKPWGIVSATNDQENHFIDESTPGVQNVEAVRALASMAAMIVSLSKFRSAQHTPSST